MLNDPPSIVITDNDTTAAALQRFLLRLASDMPGSVKFRILNSIEHFHRAFEIFNTDREMASFRAITGEEEAATALIKAIQLRRYPHAKEFNARDHQHKAAVMACVGAIASQMAPLLTEFQLKFDFEKRRVDVKVPLSNSNIDGGEKFAVQPVEPLDLVHKMEDIDEAKSFDGALKNLAARSNFDNIKKMVSQLANRRNTLLYATDSSVPESRASRNDLEKRKIHALTMLVLSVMILQSRKHQALVCQAILAFLTVISKLPREDGAGVFE
ncbi:MAG: hypothetical protein LH466_08030 [Sphingomonas bacterium]|nr:hypothetical protein [Sphingomonas bacterium]